MPRRTAEPELYERRCRDCRNMYFAPFVRGQWVFRCPDCARARHAARLRDWRHATGAVSDNRARDARRAAARAGRVCERCGTPIDAARSTKRFCSDTCRACAHRERPRQVSDDVVEWAWQLIYDKRR
jgi:hypothetical protein